MINADFDRSLRARKRVLSRFLARELILDYVEERLDSGRKLAMKEYLAKDKELSKDVEAVRTALSYVDRLVEIEIDPHLVTQIETARVGWSHWVEVLAWRNWPDVARWSLEAFAVAAVLAAAVSLMPLNRVASWLPRPAQELVLAEAKREPKDQPDVAATPPPAISQLDGDMGSDPEPSEPEAAKAAMKPTPTKKPTAEVKVAVADEKSVKSEASPADTLSEEVGTPVTATGKGPKGIVYRAFMTADTIDSTTESVKQLVETLGGTKAGQVDLGWRKSAGTYFHFALPESNYDKLMEGLRSFGPVRIYKDPHWRLMPEGQIRLILFIEDGTLKK